MDRNRRQAWLAWIFVSTLVILLVVLGILQYRWTGEVSVAERTRLRETLQASLRRLSLAFNAEVTAVATTMVSDVTDLPERAIEAGYVARFVHLKTGSYSGWLKNVWLVTQVRDGVRLRRLNLPKRSFTAAEWPSEWDGLRKRLERGGTGNYPFQGGDPGNQDLPNLVELPDFRMDNRRARPEIRWLLLEFDLDYIRDTVLPKQLELHLGPSEAQNYYAEVSPRGQPSRILFRSDNTHPGLKGKPDVTVRLFDTRIEPMFRMRLSLNRPGPPRPEFRQGGFPGGRGDGDLRRGPPPEFLNFERGRWELAVQHRAGSLEAVVARTRARNLTVIGGILALILAAGWALLRFTRRAQRLAELQMEFVASVSHELRTPLAVMRTAGHNLQGKMAADPARVRQYGALIQQESQKLTGIVEQVMSFANANAGRVIKAKQPASVSDIVAAAVEGTRDALNASGCTLETTVPPDLPLVDVDRGTIEHALQNLLANAAKYGHQGGWIGVSATLHLNGSGPQVEISVKDRGAGIPPGEIDHIFDPFYRGKHAVEDQIHGTGLGLTLSRRIVEAHGGTITATSVPGSGTEFIVRLPAEGVAEETHATNTAD